MIKNLESCKIEIQEASLSDDSEEVAFTIAGYVAKKLMKHRKCKLCDIMLLGSDEDCSNNHYLMILSRGGLTVPCPRLAEFVNNVFAILDFLDEKKLLERYSMAIRDVAEYASR